MNAPVPPAGWVYQGVWGVLTSYFRVPRTPPSLPVVPGGRRETFQPSPGFLRYLKLQFWITYGIIGMVFLALWLVGTLVLLQQGQPIWAALLIIPAALVILIPGIVAYLGLHLRYDTMWYVLTDRSMRIRRGLWIIREVTITYENVQNVKVQQGPLQRWCGVANVVVETAGSSGVATPQDQGLLNQGVLEGISNAPQIRDLILARVRASTSAGLGDERASARRQDGVSEGVHGGDARRTPGTSGAVGTPAWTPAHLEALRTIRDELRALTAR